jgi:hypothetical protein
MKGDRHHVYMVTFFTTDGAGSSVTQTFSFCSNKNGWDLQKEIEGRVRHFNLEVSWLNGSKQGRTIQNIFDCGVTGKTHGKCTKDT